MNSLYEIKVDQLQGIIFFKKLLNINSDHFLSICFILSRYKIFPGPNIKEQLAKFIANV